MKKRGLIRGIVDRVSGLMPGRGFQAAAIDRHANDHFGHVYAERPLNEDLAQDLPTLRARCRDQAMNNALVAGVINTHKTDVVGPDGPSLDVQSVDENYNKEAEDVWREWTANCDYNGQLSFSDCLRQDIEAAWTLGDSITQRLYDRMALTPIKFRLLAISSDRLDTPYAMFGDPNVVMGVRLSESGRPTTYYVSEPSHIGAYRYATGKYSPLPANQVLHVYEALEPGQVRGVPWLASSLRTIANSDAFATETIEAARTAALFGAVATVKDGMMESTEFVRTTGTTQIPRRAITYLAPGYDIQQMASQHPGTRYIEFQHEQYRNIGRPVGMPLMTVLLDARYHNYSSARYDGQVYRRHLNVVQSRLTRQRCNPCAHQVLLDAERAGLIRRRPDKVNFVWGWSQPPEIDEHKSAMADEIELRIGSKSLSGVCAARNRNFEEVVQARLRDDEYLMANGLPTVGEMLAAGSQGTPPAEDDDEETPQSNRFYVGATN